MAYEDEPVIRASLLGGSIRVNTGLAPVTLKPGQQAVFAESKADIRVIHTPGNVKAWVDGIMQLDGQSLPAIMRQLSRWYDVDVEYSGKIPSMNLVGTFSRRTSIEDIMKILNVQAGKGLEFRVAGRKITVINSNN
jgi:ferric-dicitrate binding protein FerR (iron transport regulator)